MLNAKLVEVNEGAAKVLIPEAPRIYDSPVFFNPLMRLNRDVSVLVAGVMKPSVILDALSATGIRGIRYALETEADEIWMNDISNEAFELMLKNSRLNFPWAVEDRLNGDVLLKFNDKRLVLTNYDANRLMAEKFRYFDMVDLDPFGSPVEYVDAALRSIRRRGVIAVTATDTGVLCGAYGSACIKKYLARPLRGELCHEAGLRILIGTVVRYAAKYDMGVKALLSYYKDHYFRVFLSFKSGARRALDAIKNLGYVYSCFPSNFDYEIGFLPSREGAHGPMWLGDMKDCNFVRKLYERCVDSASISRDTCEFLKLLADELEVPFFYDTHVLARRFKTPVVRLSSLIDELRRMGFNATRTHVSPTALKTTASLDDIREAWLNVQIREKP